jgi:RNA binding protein fox-1
VKYLGVVLDSKMKFKAHIRYACGKAAKVYSGLARMLCNVGGPRSSRRFLLARVVSSTLLYGAQIWADAMQLQENARKMQSVYRLSALRVISAFRTVSYEAACVIAGMKPINIAADEAKRVFEGKKEDMSRDDRKRMEEASMRTWQERWDASDKGRWTHRLIPNVEVWTNRKHGEVNYHLTQFLTGHGCYRKYLHRFGHDDSPFCPVCVDEEEDVEHVMFKCHRFREERDELFRATKMVIGPDNIVTEMLKSQEAWNAVCSVVKKVNEALRAIEKVRKSRRISEQQ